MKGQKYTRLLMSAIILTAVTTSTISPLISANALNKTASTTQTNKADDSKISMLNAAKYFSSQFSNSSATYTKQPGAMHLQHLAGIGQYDDTDIHTDANGNINPYVAKGVTDSELLSIADETTLTPAEEEGIAKAGTATSIDPAIVTKYTEDYNATGATADAKAYAKSALLAYMQQIGMNAAGTDVQPNFDIVDAFEEVGASDALNAYYIQIGNNAADAQGDVAINATNFPDPVLRQFVTTMAKQLNNGSSTTVLTPSMIKNVGSLNLSNQDVTNLAGLQKFVAIQSLNITQNDVSGDLSVLSAMPVLGELRADVMGEDFATADLSSLKNLYWVQLGGALLDVKGSITQDSNLIKVVTAPRQDTLQIAFANNLTTIDASQSHKLSSFSVNTAPSFTDLTLPENKSQLSSFYISGTYNFDNLDLSEATNLQTLSLYVYDQKSVVTTDEAGNEVLNAFGDLTYHTVYIDGALKHFKLPKSSQYLQTLGVMGMNLNAETLANNGTSLDLEKYPKLQSLNLSQTHLDAIDLSKASGNLLILNLAHNNLTNLDVSTLTKLDYLMIPGNNLTSLDLSHNPLMTGIYAQENKLVNVNLKQNSRVTVLDLSDNQLDDTFSDQLTAMTALLMLNLSNNKISTIDLSKNTQIATLDLSNNRFKTLDLTSNSQQNRSSANISNQFTTGAYYTQQDDSGKTHYYFDLKKFLGTKVSGEDWADSLEAMPDEIDWAYDQSTGVATYTGEDETPDAIEYVLYVGASLDMPVHVDLTDGGEAKYTVTLQSNSKHGYWMNGDAKEYNLASSELSSLNNGMLSESDFKAPDTDAGYHFVRWENSEGAVVQLGKKNQVFGTTTLFAVIAPDQYKVTFDNDGELTTGLAVLNKTSGLTTRSYKLPSGPTKPGYTFAGWQDDRGDIYQAFDEVTLFSDTQYTAIWKLNAPKIVNLTVTLTSSKTNANNTATLSGTASSNANLTVLDEQGATVGVGTADAKGTFTLTTQAGVYAGDELTVVATLEDNATTIYTSAQTSVVLGNALLTLNYVVDGKTVQSVSVEDKANNKTTLLSAPSKPGYIFQGWKDSVDGKTHAASTAVYPSKNVTYIAQWKAKASVQLSVKADIAYTLNKYITGTSNGKTITAYNAAGKKIAETTVKNGKFTLKLTKAQKVVLKATRGEDAATVYKPSTSLTVHFKTSPTPKYTGVTISSTTKYLTGATTPRATISLYKNGKVVQSFKVTSKDGKFKVKVQQALKKNTTVIIAVQNDHTYGYTKILKSLKVK